ncbi:MAG: alanine racemase, partial [Clostridia bacterium]|nr:alanine racemase [Clostridia bacterium]
MIPAEATSRCWAEINIGALVENYKTALSFLDKKTTLIPVLKANAYGCGAPYIAKTLYQQGARLFAVASLEEALEIKKTLSDIDILVMGLVSAPLITKA